MNKGVGLGLTTALGVGALVGGSAAARAQYQDLVGHVMSFTGQLDVYAVAADTELGVTLASVTLNDTVIFVKNPPGNSGNTYYYDPEFFQFNAGTPIIANTEYLTGSLPLPSITVNGNPLQLPTLNLSGTYVETNGAMNLTAGCTCSATVNGSADGVNYSITLSNPSTDFVGNTVAGTGQNPIPPNPNAIITGTNASLNISISGSISVGNLKIASQSLSFVNWTIAAVPGPPALAVFLPGMVGGLAALRRLRKKR